jgi:DNA-binding transcriptional MerR regulator
VDRLSIGEFARRSRLSPRALRLYDELGLLPPARVDDDSGYRYYTESQLDRAQLIAALRQLQISLADINVILSLEPDAAGERITQHWTAVAAQHAARRDLADYLVDRIQGKRHLMYEVTTREIPARSVLCLKRTVEGTDGAWAFGKEFVSILRSHHLPTSDGRVGAVFSIYWGEVSDDSDGPVEWCRPVPPTRPSSSPPRSRSSCFALSRRTGRRSSTLAKEATSNLRHGSVSRSRCMVGPTSTRCSRVSWARGSPTPQIRRHHSVKVPTATSRFRSPNQTQGRATQSFAHRPELKQGSDPQG